jgi:L-lactate utilization protein LutC
MKETTPKEKVLKRLRSALIYKNQPPHLPAEKPVNKSSENDILFAENFVSNGGGFVFSESMFQLGEDLYNLIRQNKWKNIYFSDDDLLTLIEDEMAINAIKKGRFFENKPLDAAICLADVLIAENGSVLISSHKDLGINFTSLPENLIVIASVEQIVPEWKSAIKQISEIYSSKNTVGMLHVYGGKRKTLHSKQLATGRNLFLLLIENISV